MEKNLIEKYILRLETMFPYGPNSNGFKPFSPLGWYVVFENNLSEELIRVLDKKEVPLHSKRLVLTKIREFNEEILPSWTKFRRIKNKRRILAFFVLAFSIYIGKEYGYLIDGIGIGFLFAMFTLFRRIDV